MSWKDKHVVVPAAYVVLRDGDKVLLIRRFNTGYMDGMYSLPSGHIDSDEPADEAACREAMEEVGIALKPEDLVLVHTTHRKAVEGDHERIDLYFIAKKWSGTPINAEPHKCDELKWVNINDLPLNTISEVRSALENIEKHLPFSSHNFSSGL